jgi:hypothetical protein
LSTAAWCDTHFWNTAGHAELDSSTELALLCKPTAIRFLVVYINLFYHRLDARPKNGK